MWNNHKINCVESHSIQFSSTLASSRRVSSEEWWNYHKYTTKLSKGSNNVMIWRKKDDQRDVFAMDGTMVNDIINQLSWIDWLLGALRVMRCWVLCLHFTSWIKFHYLKWKDYQLNVFFSSRSAQLVAFWVWSFWYRLLVLVFFIRFFVVSTSIGLLFWYQYFWFWYFGFDYFGFNHFEFGDFGFGVFGYFWFCIFGIFSKQNIFFQILKT